MTGQLQRRRFTVEQYHQMATAGILAPQDRVELIRGEIFERSPIGTKHVACVRRLIRLFSQRVGDRALLDVQDPIELDNRSEPQPDLVLLRPRQDFYESGHPQATDIGLSIGATVPPGTGFIDRRVARCGDRRGGGVGLRNLHFKDDRMTLIRSLP